MRPRKTGEDAGAPVQGEVHLCRACLTEGMPRLSRFLAWLDESERARAERFQFAEHRARFVVRRGLLRLLLADYLAIHPADVRFAFSPTGKPSLHPALNEQRIEFSLSHSGPLALFAFTLGHPIGVDIEQVRPLPELNTLADTCFATTERRAWEALPAAQRLPAFYRYWTLKEAVLKATGQGITEGLNECVIKWNEANQPQLTGLRGSPVEEAQWWLCSFEAQPGFVGAVAVPRPANRLHQWHWDADVHPAELVTE